MWQRRVGSTPRHAARSLGAAVGLAVLLAGCGTAPPLITNSAQAGMSLCTPAPNLPTGFSRWNSVIGVSVGMYYNQSSAPVTVQTVSLVGAHNMVLRGALVHEMVQYRNPLPLTFPWEYGADGLTLNAKLVQQVPGAVIPAGIGPVTNFPKQHPDVYDIAVGVTARRPGAAWAAGVNVGYTADGQAHTIRLLIGFAIGATPHPGNSPVDDPLCNTAMKAIQSEFASLQSS
jgi:hypothetical protein